MQRMILLTLLAFHGWTLPLPAQSPGKGSLDPVAQRRAEIDGSRAARQWQGRLQEIAKELEEGNWKRGRRMAEGLCEELSQRVIGGFEAHLGACVALRAVARMATGDEDGARWDWAVAQQLWDALEPDFVSSFGDVGARLNSADEDLATAEVVSPCTLPLCNGETIKAPAVVKSVAPEYPRGAGIGGHEGLVIVTVVVGTDGTPRNPMILQPSSAVMLTYRALEALRRWRFEPVRLRDGAAAPVFYTLSVNFVQ